MSYSFYPSLDDTGKPMLRCACELLSTDQLSRNVLCAACQLSMNLNNRNAVDLLNWLGLPLSEHGAGSIQACKLAALCQRRLWDVERNHDLALPDVQLSERALEKGRQAGYLRNRTEQLLQIAKIAGEFWVSWS